MSKMLYFWNEFIRIMKKRNLIFGLLIAIGFAVSCEEDDVCVGEGTPFLTVVMRNNIGTENLADTLTIEASPTADFANPDTLYLKAFTDSIKLPLGGLDESQMFYRLRRRSNIERDILTVNYNTQSEYVSKACGFRITYEDLSYQSTYNHIQSIEPGETNVLTDETITNLYIRLSN